MTPTILDSRKINLDNYDDLVEIVDHLNEPVHKRIKSTSANELQKIKNKVGTNPDSLDSLIKLIEEDIKISQKTVSPDTKEKSQNEVQPSSVPNEQSFQNRSCLVCENEIDTNFVLPCNCDICIKCVYYWITERNFSELFKNVELVCPNHSCRKELTIEWIYANLRPTQIKVINEILFRKYSVQTKEIRKCPISDCPYMGCVPEEKCRFQFTCEICGHQWFEKELRLITLLDFLKMSIFNLKDSLYGVIGEFAVVMLCKPCIYCNFMTYRYEGCKHITCVKCTGEWCDICHLPWKPAHDDQKCELASGSQVCCFFFFLLTGSLKVILSFWFFRSFFYYLIVFLIYFILGLALGLTMYIPNLIGKVLLSKNHKTQVIIDFSTGVILTGYLIFSWYFTLLSEINWLYIYIVGIIIILVSLYYVVVGWSKLIRRYVLNR